MVIFFTVRWGVSVIVSNRDLEGLGPQDTKQPYYFAAIRRQLSLRRK